MRSLSIGSYLLAAVAVVGAIDVAQGSNAAGNQLESRQDSPSNSPSPSEFLRRTGGTVAVLGDRIYYDGGSVSQEDWVVDGRYSNPTNTTLSIDLSTSWSPSNVTISEIRRLSNPAMEFQSVIIDEKNKCFYVWGGFSKFNIPVPSPRQFYRLCDNVWEKVDLPDANQFRQLAYTAFAASASTNDAGFIFGGREYRTTAVDGTENSKSYLSFNFTTLAWKWHDTPNTFAKDRSIWGAKAIFVPNYGPNGLIFLLGGITGIETDGQAYLSFRPTVHFMDPVTHEWYQQDATAPEGFPGTRHQHCLAGVAGENNTYDIYMFGGANNDISSAYDGVHVLSLPSFTWSLAGRVPRSLVREGHGCAIVGKSQFLTWGGQNFGDEREQVSSPDPFPQGLGIFDLNALGWKDEYNADAAPYSAHSSIVAARATPTSWTSEEVSGFFFSKEEDRTESETPQPSNNNDSGSSSPPIGAIAGGVVGGVVLVAAVAGIWFFLRRRRAKSAATPPPNAAAVTTQYELVPGAGENKYPAELHEQYQPAEMIGYGKEPPRPVHEMDGGYNNGGYNGGYSNYRP